MAEARHAELLARRERRREELLQQQALSLQGVERMTSVLVLPHPERAAAEVKRHQPGPETEATVMRVVMDHERGQGRHVEDVSAKNLGYDVTSLDTTSGDLRLIDVGYGVSQVLPVLTELFRDSRTSMFLLQQPEVHLHPSAQAALGSLFCRIARRERQLVVETHSDHPLDRVRMDVRDGRSELKPEDVSILFFERGDLDVRIHSLRLDGEGSVLGAPDSYRRFFMEETRRSLRL